MSNTPSYKKSKAYIHGKRDATDDCIWILEGIISTLYNDLEECGAGGFLGANIQAQIGILEATKKIVSNGGDLASLTIQDLISGLNNTTMDKTKRTVYHDGDGILRYTDGEEEKNRISELDKTNEKDDHKYEGENID